MKKLKKKINNQIKLFIFQLTNSGMKYMRKHDEDRFITNYYKLINQPTREYPAVKEKFERAVKYKQPNTIVSNSIRKHFFAMQPVMEDDTISD